MYSLTRKYEYCKSWYHPSWARLAKITNSSNKIVSGKVCPKCDVRGQENIVMVVTKITNLIGNERNQFISDSSDEYKAQMD